MVVTRAIDQEFINLQRQGQVALYASSRGQEAAQVASAAALTSDDWLFPQYRELGAFVWRGVDIAAQTVQWRGNWHNGHDPHAHRTTPLVIPIATHATHAVGCALGAKLDGEPTVVMCYLGDGATSEGDTHEAMNAAAVFGAPVVFFVQNNQWAISVPVQEQTHAPSLAHRGIAYGMPGRRCDGNDVLATLATARWAVDHARSGRGPVLVEAVTYRMEAHTTSDDPSRYRSASEIEHWAALDPIARTTAYLDRTGALTDDVRSAIEGRAADAATRIRAATWEAPHGDPLELFAHVFADRPATLAAQEDDFRAELEGWSEIREDRG